MNGSNQAQLRILVYMESKNITLESSINFSSRKKYKKYLHRELIKLKNAEKRQRENARALVEEVGRRREERLLFETSYATYIGTSRPNLFDAPGDYIFRRDKNNW